MENQQNINQQLYTFRYLKDQRDFLQGQLELVNASYSNLFNVRATLENLKNVKEGDEILIPIGGMINVNATIKDPNKILFFISQDVLIEKNIEGSIESVEKLIEQHKTQLEALSQNLQQIEMNLQTMSQSLQKNMPQQ